MPGRMTNEYIDFTNQGMLEKYGFKDLDEVRLIINMAFPGIIRRAWTPVYPSATWIIRAVSFLQKYLVTDSIDVMIDWAKKGDKSK